MYKRILVPLDGSKRAESIVSHIKELARCLDSEILLLRVFKNEYGQVEYFGHDPEFYEAIQANCKAETLAYLSQIQQEHLGNNLQVKLFAEEGLVIETILSVAQREEVDLIAMSSHGRTGLSRMIYGSVAAGVLNKVDRPLLLIRAVDHDKSAEAQEQVAELNSQAG
jgi:nucleotide-binding universal stress UspA family protein